MQASGSTLPPDVLAMFRTLPSPSQPPRSRNRATRGRKQQPRPVAPRHSQPSLHPLVYAQQLGWTPIGMNANPPAQGGYARPAPVAVPMVPFGGMPFMNAPLSHHNQYGLSTTAMHQGMVMLPAPPAQYSARPQSLHAAYFQAPSFSGSAWPHQPQADPFVYVRPPAEALETAKGRELFPNPPFRERLRIAQACEACRKRKSKCTGERPKCRRCEKRNIECVYVLEHRANKPRKSQHMQHSVAADPALEEDPMDFVDFDAFPCFPPAGASSSYSSSSRYSSSSGYLTGYDDVHSIASGPPSQLSATPLSLPLAPPPTLTADNRVATNGSVPLGVLASDSPATHDRASLNPSKHGIQLAHKASSSMASQCAGLPPPRVTVSCFSELSSFKSDEASTLDRLSPPQYNTDIPKSRSMPLAADATRTQNVSLTFGLDLEDRLANLVNGADQFAALPPPLVGDDAASTSSGWETRSGALTPMDYFSYCPNDFTPGSTSLIDGSSESSMLVKSDSTAAADWLTYPPSCGDSFSDTFALGTSEDNCVFRFGGEAASNL